MLKQEILGFRNSEYIVPELPRRDARGARFFSTEDYQTYLQTVSGGSSFEEITSGVVLPEQLKPTLESRAREAAQHLRGSSEDVLPVYVPLGGKGRMIGLPFAAMVQRELTRPGIYGAVNIGHEVLRAQTPLRVETDMVTAAERENIVRYVETSDDGYIGLLRAYFNDLLARSKETAEGREIHWMLLDDQRGSGLTREVATALTMHTAAAQEVTDLHLHDYTNLAPNWDHVPGHCIRKALKDSTNDSLPRGLVAEVEGYILRGGHTNGTQQELPGHVLKWDNKLSLDLSEAVAVFNAEFAGLL